MHITLFPPEKIVINGHTLCFGAPRAEIEHALGKGTRIGDRCYYFDAELAIDYDTDETLQYIECLGGIDGILRPEFDGISIFDTQAEELTALLRHKTGTDFLETERGHLVRFPALGIGLYRERTPEEIAEMEQELRRFGISTEQSDDFREEKRKADHFATIGLGGKDYYT